MTTDLKKLTAEKFAVNNRKTFLEQTRLSRIPKMPARASRVTSAICINCQSSLKTESAFCQRVKVCAPCMRIYATIDDAITKASAEKAYSFENFKG